MVTLRYSTSFALALALACQGASAASMADRTPPQPGGAPAWLVTESADKGQAKTLFSPAARPAPSAAPVARELQLSDLKTVLSTWTRPLPLNICFAGSTALTEFQVAQGAVLAQSVALWAGNVPVKVTHGPKLVAEGLNILVGVREQVEPFLPRDARVTGSFLAISKLRSGGMLLVVTGPTMAAVDDAILSLGLVREGLPERPTASIREVVLPASPTFLRQPPLESDATRTFGELAEAGVSIHKLSNGGTAMDLFFPGSALARSGDEVRLNLHFLQRRRAIGSQSAVVVTVNGKEAARSRAADIKPSAQGHSETALALPAGAFQPGLNRVEIAPGTDAGLRSRASGEDFGVLADSTLKMPVLKDAPTLPDLKLTSQTFYPFVGQPDGSDLAVHLTDRQPETIHSAWTLLAKLAQASNTLFYAAEITFEQPAASRHVLVVGDLATLSPEWKRFAHTEVFETGNKQPEAEAESAGITLGSYLRTQAEEHGWKQNAAPKPETVVKSEAAADEVFGYLACRYDNSVSPGRWVMTLTAPTSEVLAERTGQLVQTEFWSQLGTDIVRWGKVPSSVQTNIPKKAHGFSVARQTVEMPLGEKYNFRLWLGTLGVVFLLLFANTTGLLRKFDQMVHLRQRRP